MRKVLMVVYGWPPRGGVGTARSLKFAKYLARTGWQPTVLTPRDAPSQIRCPAEDGVLPGVKVLRTGYSNGAAVTNKILPLSDEAFGWYGSAVKEGSRLLEREEFDLIFSSSPPETVHLIARALKRKHSIPWVADLRDPWYDYHQERSPFLKRYFQNMLDRRTLRDADVLITISNSLAAAMRERYKQDVRVITNGFDEEDFWPVQTSPDIQGEKFTIIYTGKIHKKYQDPTALFTAIKDLVKTQAVCQKDISIIFHTFGIHRPDLESIATACGLSDIVRILPPIPYKECLARIRQANVAFLVDWEPEGMISNGIIPVKAFDYIGAQVPILLLSKSGSSDLCQIVRDSGAGMVCITTDELKKAILQHYNAFKKGSKVMSGVSSEMRDLFTRRRLAKELERVFNEVMEKCNAGVPTR